MDFRTLKDNDLSDFAANVAFLLTGTALPSIDTTMRTALQTAIGTKPAVLAAQSASASVAEAERKAAVSAKNETKANVIDLMARVRDALKAGDATKEEYDLCGFDFPKAPAGSYQAQDPTKLSAAGFSNGINRIRFSGNNQRGRVVYEVWRRQGDNGPWLLHGTTKKQSFTDSPVTPGQYYEYKVRAVAAKSISNFSNSTVVYGT